MTKTEIQTSREAANILSATLSRTPGNDLDCKMLAKTEDIKSIIVSSVLGISITEPSKLTFINQTALI